MRLTFVPDDRVIIFGDVALKVPTDVHIDVPAGLHAIQHYADGKTECEWKDGRRPLGNSNGTAGLPGGDEYLAVLTDIHAAALEQKQASEEVQN